MLLYPEWGCEWKECTVYTVHSNLYIAKVCELYNYHKIPSLRFGDVFDLSTAKVFKFWTHIHTQIADVHVKVWMHATEIKRTYSHFKTIECAASRHVH